MLRSTFSLLALAALSACTSMDSKDDSATTEQPAKTSTSPSSKAIAKSAALFPYDVQRTTLDNGLKVLMIPMPSEGLVSYWSVVRTGSRDEVEEGVTGFAHFFEHMMFRGTEKLPGPEYDHIVNGIGADANAFTTDDFTAYHLSFAKDDLSKVIEIESDRFQNLKYTVDQFKTESGAVYGEYRKGRTSPFEVLDESVRDAAFDKHTYKHTTIGFESDIRRMPEQFDYSKTFFQRFYRPESVVVVVTGDFDPKSTLEMIRSSYGGWKKGYTAPKVAPEPPQTAQRRIDVPFDGQTLPILAINFKGAAFQPGDRAMMAATLISELAFGETSRIYKQLVLDEQRVDTLGAEFGYNRDPGLWTVVALVKAPGDVKAVENELWGVIDELQKSPVPAQRLDDVRSRLKYSFLSRLSTPDRVNQSLAQLIALTGDITCIDEMYATLDSLTPEDVRKAAKAFLSPEHSTIAVLHTKGQDVPMNANEKSAKASESGATGEKTAGKAGAKNAPTPLPVASRTSGPLSEKPVLMSVPQDPNVAFRVWVKTGAQDDPPGKEGLAALTGAMIGEGGTQSRAYEQILEKLFPLAGNYRASVDKEMTIVSGLVHRDVADMFADLYFDAIVTPGFRTSDFERLRDQTISNIENELRYSSDEELGKAALMGTVFSGTPYSHIDEGTVAALKAISLDDVKSFWAAHWTRDNVVVGLGGAYSKELEAKVGAALGRLPAGKPAETPAARAPKIEGRHVTLVEKPGPTTAISIGCPIDLHRGSREYYALWIANSWLGEHRNSSSHLYQVIREARGMNYGDYSYIEAYPSGGRRTMPPMGVGRRSQMFEVWVRPVPRDQALFALRAALREVDHLAKNGLTKEQFDFTRRFLKNYVLHFAETTADRLAYSMDDRYFGTKGHLANFRRMMDEVKLEDVNAAVKKYIQVENVQIAMVTHEAAEMKVAIAGDAPSPITYPAGVTKSAEILAEDKEIERWPLAIPESSIRIVPVQEMFAGGKTSG